MANKGVVATADYTFNAAAKTIKLSAAYQGIALSDIMYITNVKSGVATVIYDPSDSTKGGALAGLVLTLAFDTTAMGNSDTLQIIVGAINQAVSLNDMTMMFKRLLDMLARPPYMNSIGQIRADIVLGAQASTFAGSSVPTTVNNAPSITNLTSVGGGSQDISFIYYTQNRDTFNNWKNNIIN